MDQSSYSFLDQVKFDDAGLVPAIAQDEQSGQILMMAWMNREALMLTAAEKVAVYWSRSRQKLWRKGEESGHTQIVSGIRLDCDGDVVLLTVKQIGQIACHTGRAHCFYRRLDNNGQWADVDAVLKDPKLIYQKG